MGIYHNRCVQRTSYTVNEFLGYSYSMFQLYGLSHIVAIICIGLFAVFVWRFSDKYKDFVRYFIIAGLVCTEILFYTVQIMVGAPEVKDYLPLHISQIVLILMTLGLIIRTRFLNTLLYFWSIWSCLLAVFLPEQGFPFPHPRYFEFFLGYMFILGGMTWLLRFEHVTITYKAMWKMYGYLLLYVGLVYVVNMLLDANYIFLMAHPSQGQMWFLPQPPWHIPFFAVGGILFFHSVYWLKVLIRR